ncbi:hypothetical protein QBC47DRAFT_412104 [Echria macrotheca]|uniref:Uncharacterized protein n=1 Tax=Echria macrotheca TaxID=438768 RepID=A0AAJ0F7E5_9PEZI|nr:hypothetical protein QBC47DRAFT_412104 [Echria macrotheca]
MGEIYGNATLTVAAASAESENGRIIMERNPADGPFSLNLALRGLGNISRLSKCVRTSLV